MYFKKLLNVVMTYSFDKSYAGSYMANLFGIITGLYIVLLISNNILTAIIVIFTFTITVFILGFYYIIKAIEAKSNQ